MTSTVQIRQPDQHGLAETVRQIYTRYFDHGGPEFESMIMRHTCYLQIVHDCVPSGTVVDIGGGWGTFNCALARVGYKSILIDDFRDRGFFNENDGRFSMPRDYGVERQCRDVVQDGIEFPPESVDVFTCLDSMEHWHHSPKRLFRQIAKALRPNGYFILAGPNCVNVRKRVSTLLGTSKWTHMSEWYEQEVFRSHVREPNIADLQFIAKDMGLNVVRIIGRNFAGYANPRLRVVTALVDPVLRLRPSLCSDICLIAQKPRL